MMRIEAAEVAEGISADLIVFDPGKVTSYTREFMKSKSYNTPFLDKTLKDSVEMVVLGREILLRKSPSIDEARRGGPDPCWRILDYRSK